MVGIAVRIDSNLPEVGELPVVGNSNVRAVWRDFADTIIAAIRHKQIPIRINAQACRFVKPCVTTDTISQTNKRAGVRADPARGIDFPNSCVTADIDVPGRIRRSIIIADSR